MNDGLEGRQRRQAAGLSDEAIENMEEYVNRESSPESEKYLDTTATLEATDQGVTEVPYPLHCEPVHSFDSSQSPSEQGSPCSTNTSLRSWEVVSDSPVDDLNASDLSDRESDRESDHNNLNMGQGDSQSEDGDVPQTPTSGNHFPPLAPTIYRAYSPIITSGIPFLPSSQDGYPSPRLEPLEQEDDISMEYSSVEEPMHYKQEKANLYNDEGYLSTVDGELDQEDEGGKVDEELNALYESIFGPANEDAEEANQTCSEGEGGRVDEEEELNALYNSIFGPDDEDEVAAYESMFQHDDEPNGDTTSDGEIVVESEVEGEVEIIV